MHRIHRVARSAAGLALAALIAGACFEDDLNDVLGPQPSGANSIFQSYVALGNSITAGYQSSGITDATQRQSYAFLLAQQMGTRYAYASMFGRGCNPPVTNFHTQAAGTTAAPIPNAQRVLICDLRNSTTATDILNNVAVPNASSFDPTDADGTPFSNTLTTLILGGKTQVQRALEAKPTFASIWIGNNDVLGFAVQDGRADAPTGLLGMTPTATFQANYDAMIDELTAGAPNLRGVLIGVVQVANAPIMFPASAMSNAAFKTSFDAIAGVTTTLDASCTSTGAGFLSIINTFLAHQIRAGAHPPIVACVAGGASGLIPAPVGDILVLDPAEQATVQARIDSYNAHIVATAASLGWAYVDPNPILSTLKTIGTLVRATPAYCGTAPCNPPVAPFGTGMSLDGVHPTLAVHREIANAIITAVNATYSTTLAPVP
jgi:lysophospholipase L1-like esterase